MLLVEDEFLVRLVAKEALEGDGFEVLEAKSASEAIQVLDSQAHIDIVVTDVRMPGQGDGVDVAVRARAKFPEIPVIMTSGYAEGVEDRLDQLCLIVFMLGKPYKLDQLSALAKSLIKRS
nr:response regulator [Pseudoroseomonas aerophila]